MLLAREDAVQVQLQPPRDAAWPTVVVHAVSLVIETLGTCGHRAVLLSWRAFGVLPRDPPDRREPGRLRIEMRPHRGGDVLGHGLAEGRGQDEKHEGPPRERSGDREQHARARRRALVVHPNLSVSVRISVAYLRPTSCSGSSSIFGLPPAASSRLRFAWTAQIVL